MDEVNNKKKSPLVKILIVIFVSGLVVGGIYYLFLRADKEERGGGVESLDITFLEAKGEETKDMEEVNQATRVIYSERIVTALDEQKNNIYQTNFYLTDSKGEKKYKFYSTEDLTYEMAYPYLGETIIILTEFGTALNRVVDFSQGVKEEAVIPDIDFGPDFVISSDDKFLGFIENESKADIASGLSFDFNFVIKIEGIENDFIEEFDPAKIKHGDIEFTQYLPVAFSSDNKILYIFASQFGQENMYENPNGLYALNIGTGEISEIYFSSIEEREDKDLLLFLGIFPKHNFALVNRGPQVVRNENTVFRSQLQKLDLATQEFSDIFVDEYSDQVGQGGDILSPDGKKIILLNDAYYDKGLSLLDIESKSKQKLTERGEFRAWGNDNSTVIYQVLLTQEKEEGGIEEKIELHALDIESLKDYKIYTQDSLVGGTGLNKEGDTFYAFIGVK